VKRVIVCCDGTWNDTDRQSEDTNVFRMARAIHATQETDALQITLYLRGVGTSGLRIERLIEGGIGLGVDDNIRSAYMFIAQNYVPKDEIFLFGFSRGAYTVRSLAGLISACGVLRREKLGDLPLAWTYYRSDPPPHSPQEFQRKYQTDCHANAEIKFLGVWDTVGALGVPGGLFSAEEARKFAFHDTGPSKAMKHGCQALAIDEHRHEFVPTLWTEPAPDGVEIEQVWFAGAHADVGGGYVTRTLADIPLVWMARKAEQDGLKLDWTCLPDPNALQDLAASHDSSSGLFSFDRFSPTFREVLQRPFPVSAFERLYAPLDNQGNRLQTIDEALHCSVVSRYGKSAPMCVTDANGLCNSETYEPKNLSPLFSKDGALAQGARVAD
jgi:uncharacterized protein (DUF2235 family)